jgi:uncharacterized SAM-binding protein YcdF (DUF218 family)
MMITNMKKYDVILVLGSQPDFRNWLFPSHTYKSLDRAIELLNQEVAPYVCLSGDHALKYDNTGIIQPFKECDKEEEYLLSKGVPPEVILKEGESRDTLAQFYYTKNLVFKPHHIKNIIMITVDFRLERIKFLFQKVFGPDYTVDFETVEFKEDEVYKNEARTLKKQKEFLKDMQDGDDAWLKDKFYDSPMYQYWKAHDLAITDPVKRFLI